MPTRTDRRGSALLTVLWLTAALSVIGLAVANNVRAETERTSTGVDDARDYFIARGAIERAILHMEWRGITDPNGQPLYYVHGQPVMDFDFPSAKVEVDIIPESSKLNINGATPQELLRLLGGLGVPIDRATLITSAILDWRTPPDPLHPSEFDAFYLNQTPSFLPRHASFQQNEEILQLDGMTPGLYYGDSLDNTQPGLRDCLSVYGSAGAVDVNTAQIPTLEAIGLAPEDARAIVQRRTIQPFLDYKQLALIQTELGPVGARLTIGGVSMFTFRATARLKQPDGKLSDMRRTLGALVQMNFPGNSRKLPPGYQILRWFDRT